MRLLILSIVFTLISCTQNMAKKEHDNGVTEINLGQKMTIPWLQISGMDWHKDRLVMVTQKPQDVRQSFYAVKKGDINQFLNNALEQVPVSPIYIEDTTIKKRLDFNNEYEAVAFYGDTAYLAIEMDAFARKNSYVEAWIVKGVFTTQDTLRLLAESLIKVPLPKKSIDEMACEALTIINDSLYIFYEANGAHINSEAISYRADLQLKAISKIKMDFIEYRVTDATRSNKRNQFWVLNSLYKGDLDILDPAGDTLLPLQVPSAENEIKRLVKLSLSENGIRIADKKTVLMTPGSWNWEAVALLDSSGFLIANDMYAQGPNRTCLVYLKMPE